MTVVQIVSFAAVAIVGTVVALLADPLRQVLALGVYGAALAFMFMALQAPDVALSQIVIGAVGLPVIVLAALRRINRHEEKQE